MSVMSPYVGPVVRRWPIILVITLIAVAVSTAWALTSATTTWTATAALSSQSQSRSPEQDGVLALGYVDYFNQEAYQQPLRAKAGIPEDVVLEARTGASSPILYVQASASDEAVATDAARSAAETFRADIGDGLATERARSVGELQAQIDAAVGQLNRPDLAPPQREVVLDQIQSLQSALTEIASDPANQLRMLQAEPGVVQKRSNPLIPVVAGGIGGLALGVLVALGLALLDRKVRTAADVRRAGLTPLAAIGGERAGGSQAEDDPHARAVERLVNSLSLVGGERSQVIAVVGVGRGPAAPRLARSIAMAGMTRRSGAILVRADLRAETTGRPRPGVVDVLEGRTTVRAASVMDRTGMHVLSAGNLGGRNPHRLVDPEQMVELVAEAGRRSALVVLDTAPPAEAPETQVMCAVVDQVILVVERGSTTRAQLAEAKALLDAVHARIAGVVVERAGLPSVDDQVGENPELPAVTPPGGELRTATSGPRHSAGAGNGR